MNIKEVLKLKKLTQYNKYLFIGPHPDDIEFGCGALISKLKELNKDVTFLIVTDGSAGVSDPSKDPNDLKNIRYNETKVAAKYLGVKNVRFCDLLDGGNYSIEDVVEKLLPEIIETNPDIIFTVDPENKTECHMDHVKVGYASRYATQLVSYPIACKRHNVDITKYKNYPKNITLVHYFTDKPNYAEKVSKKNVKDKLEALRLHVSQNGGSDGEMLVGYFDFKAKLDGFKWHKGLAEVYQVIPPIYQHVYSHGIKASISSLLFRK